MLTQDWAGPFFLRKSSPAQKRFRFPAKCLNEAAYRVNSERLEDREESIANIHLLAAMGKFETPFVPVSISLNYDGYRWAKLPTVEKVEVNWLTQLSQLGGEAAFFQDIFPYSFPISHKKLSNPAW